MALRDLIGKKVQVYWHFRKKCYSVQHKGKVVLHTKWIRLKDAKFKVSEAGRQRVLREQRKNVHAKIHGVVTDDYIRVSDTVITNVIYDPYKYENFVDKDTDGSVLSSDYALCRVTAERHPDIWAISTDD